MQFNKFLIIANNNAVDTLILTNSFVSLQTLCDKSETKMFLFNKSTFYGTERDYKLIDESS